MKPQTSDAIGDSIEPMPVATQPNRRDRHDVIQTEPPQADVQPFATNRWPILPMSDNRRGCRDALERS